MQAEQKKEFVFINLDSQESITLFEATTTHENSLDISEAIKSFNYQLPSLYDDRTFIYEDLELPIEVEGELEPKYYIPIDQHILNKAVIIIHYRNGLISDQSQEGGKQRSKQRSIREVLIGVKRWRNLHDPKIKGKERLSLQDAAKQVGFSKKSLDDYYCQLRLAEAYDFDFAKNLDQKVGVLRNFVKNNRKHLRRRSKKKHQRLSKKLMVIQTLDLGDEEALPQQISDHQHQPQKQEEIGMTPMDLTQEREFQNHFYRNLFLMDTEVIDPFVPFRPHDYRDLESLSFEYL